jgi:hypothetical protein
MNFVRIEVSPPLIVSHAYKDISFLLNHNASNEKGNVKDILS